MTTDKRRWFSGLMLEIATLYRIKLSAAFCRLYWRDLCHYPIQDLKRAWWAHRTSPLKGGYVPKPSDFMVYLLSPEKKAYEIWRYLEQQIRILGPYQRFEYPDPLSARIVANMGGQAALCQSSSIALVGHAKYFISAYQAAELKCPKLGMRKYNQNKA